MFKIRKSKDKINPYGGVYFVNSTLSDRKIYLLIDKILGNRALNVGYSYSDCISTLVFSHLCGGSCLEDINYLRDHFNQSNKIKFCSPDTISIISQELADTTWVYTTVKGIEHEININKRLNILLSGIVKHCRLINSKADNVMDYDNVVLPNDKYDSKRTYKHVDGYQPGVAFINRLPVYIEGRNGNSPAKYLMAETLSAAFNNVDGINVKYFRSDCAAYQKSVIEVMEEQEGLEFFIRIMSSPDLLMEITAQVKSWEKVLINKQEMEVASIDYCPFGGEKSYRVVVHRKKRDDGQTDLFSQTSYDYYGIITNNCIMTDEEVVDFYNQRASIEPNFAYLNNDFNWSHLPFSWLDLNTVYMILSAVSFVLFEYIKKIYGKKLPFVRQSMRIKSFILRFIAVPVKWVRTARQTFLRIYSQKDYQLIVE
jgi:hypothetical protein